MMWRGVTRGPRFLGGRTMAMFGCKVRKFVCYPIADHGEASAPTAPPKRSSTPAC